mmetsp:Transcript_22328/g.44816  ORF Transcript_22328/g.44816 Transcript_22328/m.44816 type:complete len:678 (+) Transcript_22328:126-2159(+)
MQSSLHTCNFRVEAGRCAANSEREASRTIWLVFAAIYAVAALLMVLENQFLAPRQRAPLMRSVLRLWTASFILRVVGAVVLGTEADRDVHPILLEILWCSPWILGSCAVTFYAVTVLNTWVQISEGNRSRNIRVCEVVVCINLFWACAFLLVAVIDGLSDDWPRPGFHYTVSTACTWYLCIITAVATIRISNLLVSRRKALEGRLQLSGNLRRQEGGGSSKAPVTEPRRQQQHEHDFHHGEGRGPGGGVPRIDSEEQYASPAAGNVSVARIGNSLYIEHDEATFGMMRRPATRMGGQERGEEDSEGERRGSRERKGVETPPPNDNMQQGGAQTMDWKWRNFSQAKAKSRGSERSVDKETGVSEEGRGRASRGGEGVDCCGDSAAAVAIAAAGEEERKEPIMSPKILTSSTARQPRTDAVPLHAPQSIATATAAATAAGEGGRDDKEAMIRSTQEAAQQERQAKEEEKEKEALWLREGQKHEKKNSGSCSRNGSGIALQSLRACDVGVVVPRTITPQGSRRDDGRYGGGEGGSMGKLRTSTNESIGKKEDDERTAATTASAKQLTQQHHHHQQQQQQQRQEQRQLQDLQHQPSSIMSLKEEVKTETVYLERARDEGGGGGGGRSSQSSGKALTAGALKTGKHNADSQLAKAEAARRTEASIKLFSAAILAGLFMCGFF